MGMWPDFCYFCGEIYNMLNFFKEYIRGKALKRREPRVSPAFLNIKDVKSVGFVFVVSSPSDLEELCRVTAFLDEVSVMWKGVAVELKKGLLEKMHGAAGGEVEVKGVDFIGKGQMDWAGIPQVGALEPFLHNEFDLFICLNASGEFTPDYIAGGVNARMSAGMCNTRYHSYPFVLEPGKLEPAGYADYLKQLFHYLSIIK